MVRRRKGGHDHRNETTRSSKFVALEIALEIVASLRDVVRIVRRHDAGWRSRSCDRRRRSRPMSARAIAVRAKIRLHFFRIAAGSAEETRVHLRVAVAWGWLRSQTSQHRWR